MTTIMTAETETIPETNYAKSPADIRATAELIAKTYVEAVLAGAICSALVMERERCAKVAENWHYPPENTAHGIAAAIRRATP